MQQQTQEALKHAGDAVAASTGVGIFAQWAGFLTDTVIPPIVGVLTVAWLTVRLWETKTVQGWVQNRKAKR